MGHALGAAANSTPGPDDIARALATHPCTDPDAAAILQHLNAACYQIVPGIQWADAAAIRALGEAIAASRGHAFDPDDLREAFAINDALEHIGRRIALGAPDE